MGSLGTGVWTLGPWASWPSPWIWGPWDMGSHGIGHQHQQLHEQLLVLVDKDNPPNSHSTYTATVERVILGPVMLVPHGAGST